MGLCKVVRCRELEIILPVSRASVFLQEVGYANLDRWVQVGDLRRTLGCWESKKPVNTFYNIEFLRCLC